MFVKIDELVINTHQIIKIDLDLEDDDEYAYVYFVNDETIEYLNKKQYERLESFLSPKVL
jgi:hypothetical protein